MPNKSAPSKTGPAALPTDAKGPRRSGHTPRQRALLKTGALQSAILNSSNFASIATDERGLIQVFNVGAERMLGYSAAEVLNQLTPADLCDPQDLAQRAEALGREPGGAVASGFEALVFKASRGIEDIGELVYLRKDGSRLNTIVSATALRDAAGVIIGYLLVGTDNTARKQVEAEQARLDARLRDQQFYTRSLIESIIDALITTDPQGVISDVNEQTEALMGRSRDELIGTPFRNYFTDPERAQRCIERVLSELKLTNYELTAETPDRRQTIVSCNATPFYDRDRRLCGVIASARDVTERKRLDGALQDSNQELNGARITAERANLAKSDFLSSMSHELRSPLNAILGFAQLMDSGLPAPTVAQKDSIDQILQAGWYLLELINEVLDLSLIESGKVSLSLEPVSLAEVLADCQAMIEPQARSGGIRISFSLPDTAVSVRADRTRLKQIFVNLLSNAIKYNRVGGSVDVTCGAGAGGRLRVSFQDTGEGLSADKQAHLFEAFNRLGQEGGVEQGTGIGLVVCKRLVALMGGEIGVDSTVGVGSLFWVEMGAAQALTAPARTPAGATAPLTAPAAGLHRHTVLCVEDNGANLKLVAQLVARRPDIHLLSARDGRRGIEIARESLPDVILMDINLPGISGLAALRILAGDAATAHIPVVALSANAMPRDIEKGLQAGFFRYLTKPIKVNEFMDTLDQALKAAQAATTGPAA
jgi:PAS domain S-box-containing protein